MSALEKALQFYAEARADNELPISMKCEVLSLLKLEVLGLVTFVDNGKGVDIELSCELPEANSDGAENIIRFLSSGELEVFIALYEVHSEKESRKKYEQIRKDIAKGDK